MAMRIDLENQRKRAFEQFVMEELPRLPEGLKSRPWTPEDFKKYFGIEHRKYLTLMRQGKLGYLSISRQDRRHDPRDVLRFKFEHCSPSLNC